MQLSNGKVVVAWTADSQIRFAILDTAYNRTTGPTTLYNSAATTGDNGVSTAADASGRAILTWMDAGNDYQRNLYYALVDGNGVQVTSPMIFRTSQANYSYTGTRDEVSGGSLRPEGAGPRQSPCWRGSFDHSPFVIAYCSGIIGRVLSTER